MATRPMPNGMRVEALARIIACWIKGGRQTVDGAIRYYRNDLFGPTIVTPHRVGQLRTLVNEGGEWMYVKW